MKHRYENFTKIFIDGADNESLEIAARNELVAGITTNPTLMANSGITNYLDFAKSLLIKIKNKSVSLEVFSDDFEEMKYQARILSALADNVFVKIPVYNSVGESSLMLIKELTSEGIKINITAILESDIAEKIVDSLNPNVPSYVSVFAGRIADTGRNPVPILKKFLLELNNNSKSQLIWASPREVLNYYQADEIGCHIITMTKELFRKLELKDKDLTKYSVETVRMFYEDAKNSGFSI